MSGSGGFFNRALFLLGGALLWLGLAWPAGADESDNNYWGAIAYSQSTGQWGYSRHWLSDVNARRVALENCKAKDAQIVLLVGNYWCALALGADKSAYGVGYATTPEEAKKFALKECQKHTTNAKVVLFFNIRDDDLAR